MQENKMGVMPVNRLVADHVCANHDFHAGAGFIQHC